MDGYEATRRIRGSAAAEGAAVPIVAMTDNVFKEDVEKCLAAGMNGHLGKPIDFEELLRQLDHYLL
jgi:CheY-like chemotaxis protein